MARKPPDPFDVKLSEEDEKALTTRLCQAVRIALQARSSIVDDGQAIDFAYSLYEQQSQKGISRDSHRYGQADLTSPIGTQMVDSLTARATKTIFVEPFWIVEGVGESARKAPAVEEFMQWRLEDIRGQSICAQGIRQSFIEEGAVLEVCEDTEPIQRHEVVKALIARADDGTMLLNAKDGKPLPARNPETGDLLAAEDPSQEFVEVHRTWTDAIRRGASLRLHSLKDFLFLPGHARDRREVWGHAARVWLRLDELKRAEERKEYKHVDKLGGHHERDQRAERDRTGTNVEVDHDSDTVEKECWRVQFLADLGEGLCFYVATISVQHEVILRLKADWLGRFRSVYLNPFPRTYSVYGYSVILHKLLTTIEEHTAWRNMNADRATLKSNAPLKRLVGAQYDPSIQPFEAGICIDVGNMNEVQPFEFEDVTPAAMQKERDCYEDAVRIIGVNDISSGVTPKLTRTLGENEMVTEQSFVRIEEPIRNLQEAFEELGELMHAVEVKTLEGMERGIQAPASVTQNVGLRMQPPGQEANEQATFDGTFTAPMVSGTFRFKPRGSVESADPNKRINAFTNLLDLMGKMMQLCPPLAMRYQSPQVADAINQQFVDLAKIRDKQAFLAPLPPPPLPPGMPGGEMGAPVPPSFGGQDMVAQMAAQLPPGVQ